MFWGKSRQRENDERVRKGKLRPRTAPETQTLSKLGAERRTVHKRKKTLKVFRKRRINGNLSTGRTIQR